ncbi:MAG: hypothetical protein F6J94_12920 [Moorea sp. SIO1F2]|uniref:hypothetical protein n=1 Tax=Moorena sp. SIO1F2 TaxID=2607819 RepID=UPI0013BB30EB|nr:hypothetical protein [Moorena sp. SIO1F2]NEN99180.1 hypothetical protein [Moorena sp. SIO3I7]NET82790.1 hypothetical protein [Moorena sp. SIO1F2]
MNWQAVQAEERLNKTGKITVVVQDQGSIHTSKLTKSNYDKWESLGLYIALRATVRTFLNSET